MSELLGGRKKSGGGLWKALLALAILGGLGAFALVTLRSGDAPTAKVEPGKPAVGKRTAFTVTAAEPKRGLTSVVVELVQGETVTKLGEAEFAPQPPWFVGPKTADHSLTVEVGKDVTPGLVEGEATVRVRAAGAGTWLKTSPETVAEVTVPVRLTPPSLEVRTRNIFVAQGGCEVVIYAVGDTAVRHGVRAGAWTFPGYPLPGSSSGEMFALFAVPYDMADVADVRLFAEDEVENRAEMPFVDQFTPRPYATDDIRVSKRVMQKVVTKILAKIPSFGDRGDLVKTYVAINSEMRKANNDRLVAMASRTAPKFFWNRSFVQMPAKAVSTFADRRTYYFEGRVIDKQDHLGFDLASTRRAPIPASNAGAVVFAGYLGIYGNAVVIDHGFGLMSLYAHLSEISVKEGDTVERAQTIGRTGATGLALGDHLHFTMMLHGLPVTPLEWWDGHWIRDRLALKLGDSLGFVDGEAEK